MLALILLGFLGGWLNKSYFKINPDIAEKVAEIRKSPLNKYSIENLSNTNIKPGKLEIKEEITEEENYNSYLFEFEFNPNLDGKTKKITTGQLNIPKNNGTLPLIVMFRGYIDQEMYKTGFGTRKAASYFAENGFLTIAPDFLGYGGSDDVAENIFESRFQTYVTSLSLIKTLETNPELALETGNREIGNLYLWGHSNGGQIALTTLEITNAGYPTTLWAPVSKPFPYSVLYYTDRSEDRGKLIRSELAKFEDNHDPDNYSLDLYLDKINAPLQIHQGTSDDAVPVKWSDELANELEELEKDVTYYKYPGADHNLRPVWNEVVRKDLIFFRSFLK